MVFSDIRNFVQSMLATRMCSLNFLLIFSLPLIPRLADDEAEASHVVHEGKLKKGCFVRLKSFQANEVKGKK